MRESRQINIKKLEFLQEAIDCYEIGARHAAVVLVWILTIHHLCEYIYKVELSSFNAGLLHNSDRRVKILKITKMDDFLKIPEDILIDIAYSVKIISDDVHKMLGKKFEFKNTTVKPSTSQISETAAVNFITDLLDHVLLKYDV